VQFLSHRRDLRGSAVADLVGQCVVEIFSHAAAIGGGRNNFRGVL
jgi:hypothetical protein